MRTRQVVFLKVFKYLVKILREGGVKREGRKEKSAHSKGGESPIYFTNDHEVSHVLACHLSKRSQKYLKIEIFEIKEWKVSKR